jgi:hypothetical protein
LFSVPHPSWQKYRQALLFTGNLNSVWQVRWLSTDATNGITFNPLNPSGYFLHDQVQDYKSLRSVHTEQTAIISLCNIERLVFITETEWVYCAVRAEPLNVIWCDSYLSKAVSWLRRIVAGLTVQAYSRCQASPCGICAGQSGEGQVYAQVPRFFRVSVIPPILHTNRMDKRPKPGDLQTKQCSFMSSSRDNIWNRVLHVFGLRLGVSATQIISCRMGQDSVVIISSMKVGVGSEAIVAWGDRGKDMEDFSDLLNQQILCLPNKYTYKLYILHKARPSRWPRGQRRGFAAVRLLGLRVRIPAGVWICLLLVLCAVRIDISASRRSLFERSPTVYVHVNRCDNNSVHLQLAGRHRSF